MKRQALMHRLLLLSMLMYLLNACVPYAPSPRDFRPSRLSCDELQGLQEMFQPYWGKQLTEEDVKTIVQSRYRISEEQFKNRGFNEFDGELWWMSWPLDDIGITVFTDAQDILVRVGIGWHSYAETALTPIIRPGELAQCLGTEPEWYHAGMRQHFECGIQYQYTTYYPQIGLTAEGSGCVSYNTLPPPVTQDSPYNGLILVQPGSLTNIYCRTWGRDITKAPPEEQPQPWSSWESIEYLQNSFDAYRSLPECRMSPE